MPTRSYKPEQIVAVPRQIEVQMGNGRLRPKPAKKLESTPKPTTGGGRNTAG